MSRTNWFDDIALTYARNFDEVEAARSAYTQQRQTILATLVRVCESAFEGTTFNPIERTKPEGGWETFWASGQFTRAKIKAGKGPRQAAVVFGMDSDPCFESAGGGCFGFGTYLLFKMSKQRYEQLRTALASVNVPFDYYSEDSAAYLRGAWIRPTDAQFKREAFEEEVLKLPELFAKADEAIGAGYHELKFG
jgi:hypothetical protein